MEAPATCARCHSDEVLPIAYGLPSPAMVKQSIGAPLLLGGRTAWPESPDWYCVACGHEWREDEPGDL
jgi:hypothetical protein